MSLSRYDILDAYTLEELRRQYQASDAKDRIQLLDRFYKEDKQVPYEIAVLAVEDPNVEVRQWIASHGKFLDMYDHPRRNLEDELKKDQDPFVRACLRENPNVFGGIGAMLAEGSWEAYFKEAADLERLALVRNPNIRWAKELLKKIFDPEDRDLDLDLQRREQVVYAFLSNREAVGQLETDAGLAGHRQWDGWTWYSTNEFLSSLWRLASRWPKKPMEIKVQAAVYRYLPASDETKADIYRSCDEPVWRQEILWNCNGDDRETLKLGIKDSDERCRYAAYTKVHRLDANDLETILKSESDLNLSALSANKQLPLSQLERIVGRLSELSKDSLFASDALEIAQETLDAVRKEEEGISSAEVPYEKDASSDKKIDFLLKKVLSYEEQVRSIGKDLKRVLIILAAAWVGWKLIVWVLSR